MSPQVTEKQSLTCPAGHVYPEGVESCPTCNLPIVDFEAEIDLLLKSLGEDERRLKLSKEKIFLGIGDRGCRLAHTFLQVWGKSLKASGFLMIDSSGEAQQLISAIKSEEQDPAFPSVSFHLLPAPAGKQVGYFALGQEIASNDPGLDDRLLRSGIRSSTRKQILFMLTALGGGTGSGATPLILDRCRTHNPNLRNLVIALMPGRDEQDGAHFNAICSLSRLVGGEQGPLADMVFLVENDRLLKVRGIGNKGEEVAREELLSYMIAAMVAAYSSSSRNQLEPGYLAKMSRSLGIHVFVPCIAVGRSLEIFGNLTNVLESTLLCPLAPVDRNSVTASYVLVDVPDHFIQSLHEERVRNEINRWNKEAFPRLKESAIQLTHSPRKSDRIDVFLLLGGMTLAVTAKTAREGFERFKLVAKKKTWEQEFGAASSMLSDVDAAISSYDSRLTEMLDTGTSPGLVE